MKHAAKLFAALFAVLYCAAFTAQQKTITLNTSVTSQPYSERSAQDRLPQSHDPVWKILMATKISQDKKTGFYAITATPEIKKLVGTQITITGFILPLEEKEKFHHLILSRRTPVCAFCPPGEPNEIIDVMLTEPMLWEDNLVSITGKFELINNAEKGIFFHLSDAHKNDGKKQ